MAFTIKNIFPNVSRHSNAARAAAEISNAQMVYGLSRVLNAAGTVGGTTTSKVKFVTNITYMINGAFYAKNATDDFWALSGTAVAASSFQKYLLMIDTAGAASVQEATQSKVSAAAVTWTNVSGISAWAPFLSAVGSTKCIVGVLTVATNASNTFTPGSTALNAAGITTTYTDGIDQSILPLIGDQAGNIIGYGG